MEGASIGENAKTCGTEVKKFRDWKGFDEALRLPSSVMSAFFTLPASQRKRKRDDTSAATSSNKRLVTARGSVKDSKTSRNTRPERDESISGSASEDGEDGGKIEDGAISSSDSESDDETAAERRLRLAEQYLQNIKGEVDEVGYDAEEIDKDLIAERLQEDVVCLITVAELSFCTLTKCQGRNQRTPLPAYNGRPCVLQRNQHTVSFRYRHDDLHRGLPSLCLYGLQRHHSYKMGASYPKASSPIVQAQEVSEKGASSDISTTQKVDFNQGSKAKVQ